MHSVSGGGIGSNGYHWKNKNKVVERRTFGGGWGMYENVPKTREEKQKTENIPKIRHLSQQQPREGAQGAVEVSGLYYKVC